MTMRTVRRQIPTRGVRRARQWAITSQNFTMSTTVVAIDLQTALETDLDANLHNVTVAAIRLTLGFQFATASTVGDRTNMFFGVIWVGNDALATGFAALPSPIDDSADWIMHGSRLLVSNSAAIHAPRNGTMDFFGDAQRKQRENHSTLVLIGVASIAEHGVQIFVGGRVLFILP